MSPHPRRGISIGLLGHLLLSGPAIAQVARIPFEFHRNKILLPVTVNGSGPYEFILDSGSPVTVVSSRHGPRARIQHRAPGGCERGR